jgi:ketosteroid isomerase-like protein
MRIPVRIGSIMAGLLVGAASAAAAEPGGEAVRAQLMRVDAEFSQAAQTLGVGEAFLRYADADATMLPPGQGPVTGLAGVREQFADFPAGTTLAWKPFKAEAAASGDLGYTLGTYEMHGKDKDGKPVVRYGKYCSVWKKQKDGAWKWVVDVGTPSPAPGGQP